MVKIHNIISKHVFRSKNAPIDIHIRKIIIHSENIPSYYEMNVKHDFDYVVKWRPENYTLFVIRSSRQYLGSPYGQCSDYRNSDSKSRQLCYRKCFRHNLQETKHCIPLFIDFYISELDSIPNKTKYCWQITLEWKQKFKDKCMKLCPKECLKEEYSFRVIESDSKFISAIKALEHWRHKEDLSLYSKSIEWDSSEPMFAYTEEPVTTFSDYLVNCGGLMGLW